MAGMVMNAGCLFDQIRNALKGPELARIAVGLRALQQGERDLVYLLPAEASLGSGCGQFQGVRAFVAIACAPLADGRSADAETSSDFGIGQSGVKHRDRLLAQV